jgi:hypothetical protein
MNPRLVLLLGVTLAPACTPAHVVSTPGLGIRIPIWLTWP